MEKTNISFKVEHFQKSHRLRRSKQAGVQKTDWLHVQRWRWWCQEASEFCKTQSGDFQSFWEITIERRSWFWQIEECTNWSISLPVTDNKRYGALLQLEKYFRFRVKPASHGSFQWCSEKCTDTLKMPIEEWSKFWVILYTKLTDFYHILVILYPTLPLH